MVLAHAHHGRFDVGGEVVLNPLAHLLELLEFAIREAGSGFLADLVADTGHAFPEFFCSWGGGNGVLAAVLLAAFALEEAVTLHAGDDAGHGMRLDANRFCQFRLRAAPIAGEPGEHFPLSQRDAFAGQLSSESFAQHL